MKAICLYFQIHQPFRLKNYPFLNIGNDHYYYDDFSNDEIITKIAQKSYIPATKMLLEIIKNSDKKFKVAFSITGTALEQLEMYVPEFIDSMKELVATGCVEFLSETYSHSLCSLIDPEEFREQVKSHSRKIYQLFGQHPKIFRNTALIYSDEISTLVGNLGFNGIITEDAKHVLGWKSPNYVYNSATYPKLKILLKNSSFTDDIAFHFSDTNSPNYPITADSYIDRISKLPKEEKLINIYLNYETLGELQGVETGIFEFMKALPRFAQENNIQFWTPSEAIKNLNSVGELVIPYPISWADEARDTSAWLGNTLQQEAFNKLYSIGERVRLCNDKRIKQDWHYLQGSDHFFYMCTKYSNDGILHSLYSPYETPYLAFTNYMNVLSDFIVRVEAQYPISIENEELNALITTIRNQASEIEELKKEVAIMRNNILKDEDISEHKTKNNSTKSNSKRKSKKEIQN